MKPINHKLLTHPLILLICLIFTGLRSEAQQPVTLEGKAPSYAGGSITFYRYTDYITRDTLHLANSDVDPQGRFACRFKLGETTQVFANLGTYKGYMFAEPGKNYVLALPKKKKKTQAQQLNPFFEGIPVHIGIKSASNTGLNHQIFNFSSLYKEIVNKNLNNIKGLARQRDSVLKKLDTTVNYDHPFFKDYKRYTLASLKLPLGFSAEKIEKQYFAAQPVLHNNPAYMEAFATLYNDYLKELFSRFGNQIYRVINGKQSYALLDSLCRQDSLLGANPELRELVMLHSLHDAYHDDRFSGSAIRHMLDTFPSLSDNTRHLEIASHIRQKATILSPGEPAPEFCLYDADSSRVCLEDFSDQYIYLGFCNAKNYSCMRHYKLLENLAGKHRQHFRIVIISNNSFSSMARFVRHHEYSFTFLHYGEQKDILKDYRVRSMPAYYFIEPGGELSIAPAPPPSENIEQRIYKKMKANGDL